MKKKVLLSISLLAMGVFLLGTASVAMAGHEIVGAAKCKMCHKKVKVGAQYPKWAESKHAKAYETLASDEAKKIATEKGLGDPQKEEACLKCHTTQDFLGADVAVSATGKYVITEGVGCEACHGAGSDYKKKSVMKDHDAAVAAGMTREKSEAFCVKCHNDESPTFKAFDFEKQWAEIDHPIVAKEKKE